MSLWDTLSDAGGGADRLRPLLEQMTDAVTTSTEADEHGTWDVATVTQDLTDIPGLDLATGGTGAGTGGSLLELRDPRVTVAVGLLQAPASGWRVIITSPLAAVRIPGLVGAKLDAQGQLIPDPASPTVRFVVPQLRVRVMQLGSESVGVKLLSATTTTGGATDDIYELVRMEPAYALIGPGSTVGFAFRTAVLDLSGDAAPDGIPADARVQPAEWQGFFLPEVRLFVSPEGLEGIAVSAGVRNLWIGVGEHAGVTGLFEAEVVHRGSAPRIQVSFRGPGGRYIPDPGAATVDLPEEAMLVVDTAGGIAPVAVSIVVGSDPAVNDDRARITTPAAGTLTITVTARDGGGHDAETRTLTVRRATGSPGAADTGSATTVRPIERGSHVIVKHSETATEVTVRLEPRVSASWQTGGGPSTTGETFTVPVAAGAPVAVSATLATTGTQTAGCWFLFDRPTADEVRANPSWGRDSTIMRDQPAAGRDAPAVAARPFQAAMAARQAQIGAGTRITVDGYASWETPGSTTQDAHNGPLSERRRDAAIAALRAAGFADVQTGVGKGSGPAEDGDAIPGLTDAGIPAPGSSFWWLAVARWEATTAEDEFTAEITRTAIEPLPDPDPRPADPVRPDCFRRIGVRVEIVRDTLVRAEVYGEFDIETAAESALTRSGQPPLRTGARNDGDGICLFLVRLRLSEDREAWDVTAQFRAAREDVDGLTQITRGDANPIVIDAVGALAVLAPLSSAATELSPAAGAIVALGSLALGAASVIETQELTLHGAELVVSHGVVGADGITAESDEGVQISILLDVEIAFTFNIELISVAPDKPLTARYQAVGVRSQWGTDTSGGGVEYVPLPVFDPSRGYSLDVPAGALMAKPPLDEILRVLGFRVSRDNPTFLEVEVGLGVDLGIVSVDTVRVRIQLDDPSNVELTKLGATIDVPGALHGAGTLEITDAGFKGAFDLTVTAVNLRIGAVLAVEQKDGVTGVLIGGRVEFPVPILLGGSGLGIYGFMGGVGVNFARDEAPFAASLTPALDWVMAQYRRPGQVMAPEGWRHQAGAFAFAAGIALGTVDGGFTVHLDGIVVLELPGPRLLLIMKADVLSLPPAFGSDQTASFLAVLDIDFGRGSILLAIVAQYEIEKILFVRVPVTASFSSEDPEAWFVDLGRYPDSERVSVKVLDTISGSGYLMVHGDGISLPTDPALVVPSGFAVATGFHLQAVLMGSKAVGLYLEVAAGFDAVLGLDPFFLGGIIYVRGELRLWIVGISASAKLIVQVGTRTLPDGSTTQQPYVHGEVCGKVDFFFFSVKGCVSLTIGAEPDPTPTPRDLVAGVSLVARTAAKLDGTGAEQPIDGKLGDAARPGTPDEVPVVPIDAIPIVSFRTAPEMNGAPGGSEVEVFGQAPVNDPAGGPNRWTRIGDRWWRYRVKAITLSDPLLAGPTPSTWLIPPATTGPHAGPALALLDWLPTATPTAVPYGEQLVETVRHQWGTVCADAAPAAQVLWTFHACPDGPSDHGWQLTGTPLPDPAGTVRGQPAQLRIRVTEPWRIAPPVDLAQGTAPARIIGDAVPCATDPIRDLEPLVDPAASDLTATAALAAPSLTDVTGYLAAGGSLHDLPALADEFGWTPDPESGCRGALLRAPLRDLDTPAPWGTDEDRARVKAAWERTGFRPHELGDAVVFSRRDDAFTAFAVLMLVDRASLRGQLVLRCESAEGIALDETPVTTAHLISATNPLPGAWTDVDLPWADPVRRAAIVAGRLSGRGKSLVAVFVPLPELPPDTARIVIGRYRVARQKTPGDAFYVVAASGALRSETARRDWDEQHTDRARSALSNALTHAADDVAMLVPGATYTLSIDWEATSSEADEQPAATDDGDGWNDVAEPQRFVFRADHAAPETLGPWVTTTSPNTDETGAFTGEPVRIVFATQRVAALFDAYGRELRVTLRAASGAHPAPPGGGDPADGFTLPADPDGVVTRFEDAAGVLGAWHTAALEVVRDDGLGCVNVDARAEQVYTFRADYDLEPLTDYLIDVHSVDSTTGGDAKLVHRVGFTTSRFRDTADLASLTLAATVEHRAVADVAALAALPDRPGGAAVDDALQATGVGVDPVPPFPRTRVLWSSDPEPQPLAVILDSGEPLWRTRTVPTWIPAPAGAPEPKHGYWAARPDDWLVLEPDASPPAADDLPRATVQRIIRGPGDTRAIVILAPASRGREARLALVWRDLLADPVVEAPETAVRIDLQQAPWEVEY